MPSTIAWLDYCDEDQRRTRELLRMMGSADTVDDLGFGRVRDAFSDLLFPGLSSIQTRARYMLFVPWAFLAEEHRSAAHTSADAFLASAARRERLLVEALKKGEPERRGLIGGDVGGAALRTLPSAIYWGGLATFGIFRRPELTIRQYGRALVWRAQARQPEVEDERASRIEAFWAPLPEPPEGFHDYEQATLSLLPREAAWLRERFIQRDRLDQPSLLGCLAEHADDLPSRIGKVDLREGTLPAGVPRDLRALVHHAERFALAMEIAALVYNVMLREERCNGEDDNAWASQYRQTLGERANEADSTELTAWAADPSALWRTIGWERPLALSVGPAGRTMTFVDRWLAELAKPRLDGIADRRAARELIRDRELQHKKGLARLANRARLDSLPGGVGLRRPDFRWGTARAILADLRDGLDAAPTAKGGARAGT